MEPADRVADACGAMQASNIIRADPSGASATNCILKELSLSP